MLRTHPGAAESVSKWGETTTFGQGWEKIQQWKPEKTTLMSSHKRRFPLCPQSFAHTQQWNDAGPWGEEESVLWWESSEAKSVKARLLFLPFPVYWHFPGKKSYCSHSPAAEISPWLYSVGPISHCLAPLWSDILLWYGLQFIKCPFCIGYPVSAHRKVLKDNPLLEVFKHPSQLILVEMEKGLFTGTAHLADGKGRGGYFHQGGGKDQVGARWHHLGISEHSCSWQRMSFPTHCTELDYLQI